MIPETKWAIDPVHSEIAFKVRHLMIAYVKGVFKVFDASIYTTGKDFTTAEIDLIIDAASINTGDVNRDDHLRSDDFLDVEKHRQIRFTSAGISAADKNGNHECWGDLTIRGVTKNMQMNVKFGGIATDPTGVEKAGFTITGKLNRSDFGLIWSTFLETGGLVVGEEIRISCDIELINTSIENMTLELDSTGADSTIY